MGKKMESRTIKTEFGKNEMDFIGPCKPLLMQNILLFIDLFIFIYLFLQ